MFCGRLLISHSRVSNAGCPNVRGLLEWTVDAVYDYVPRLSMSGWAWEFLRRNPTYVADWSRVAETLAANRDSIDIPMVLKPPASILFSKWGLIFR